MAHALSPSKYVALGPIPSPWLLSTLVVFLLACSSSQAQSALQCAPVRGAGTTGSFNLASPSITLSANCGANFYSVDWGDTSNSSSNGSSAFITNHSYGSAGPWLLTVNSDAGSGDTVVGFPTAETDFLSGQTLNVLAKLAIGAVGATGQPVQMQVTCDTVVAPDGTLVSASSLGITCGPGGATGATGVTAPSTFMTATRGGFPVVLCQTTNCTGVPLATEANPTALRVFTTGRASIFAQSTHSRASLVLTFAMLGPGLLLCFRRSRLRTAVALCSVPLLCVSLTSCGGGFKTPTLVSSATPPGNYQLNIVLTSNTTPGFIQITLIVPLTITTSQ